MQGQYSFDLDSPYSLSCDQIRWYRENGFVKLKDVLAPETLNHFRERIVRKVHELSGERRPLNERTIYDRAFLQVWNLWRHCEQVKSFVMGQRLARIAAQLMGCRGVRLYHDQALF